MSIGSSFQWSQYPTATAADRLVNKGVVVVASIGNSGSSGAYAAGAPGVGSKVIGVANFVNTHQYSASVFTISSDDKKIGYRIGTGAPLPPGSGTSPMTRTGTSASTTDACNGVSAPAAGSLTGKVALIRRGTCGFHEKVVKCSKCGGYGSCNL